MKRILLILTALSAPGLASAVPSYSDLKTECVAGVQVARSATTMIQLTDPKTGLPMSCGQVAKLGLKHAIEIDKLKQELTRQSMTHKAKMEELQTYIEDMRARRAELEATARAVTDGRLTPKQISEYHTLLMKQEAAKAEAQIAEVRQAQKDYKERVRKEVEEEIRQQMEQQK